MLSLSSSIEIVVCAEADNHDIKFLFIEMVASIFASATLVERGAFLKSTPLILANFASWR